MMLRAAIVLALAVGALAGGCFFQEDYTCVRKNAVKCGGDWCHGHCSVDFKKSCDTKVWFKTVCKKEDYCAKIETPCGHDGTSLHGLSCGAGEECVADKSCKLIPAHKKKSFAGWHATKVSGGLFEVCKDVYSCAPVDPWALDVDAIDVVCTKEYEIVDDMDCTSLWDHTEIWGGIAMNADKFYKLNRGFSCDKKLVGKIICVEADAHIKADVCGDSICDHGYECATREICSEVATEKPICAKKPVHTCLTTVSSGASLCGNQFCGPHEKCEIISNKICPQVLPIPVPGPVVLPVPTPVVPLPTPTVTPSARATSTSISDEIGTATLAEAIVTGDAEADAGALALKGATESESLANASRGRGANAATFSNAEDGQTAEADALAELN